MIAGLLFDRIGGGLMALTGTLWYWHLRRTNQQRRKNRS